MAIKRNNSIEAYKFSHWRGLNLKPRYILHRHYKQFLLKITKLT